MPPVITVQQVASLEHKAANTSKTQEPTGAFSGVSGTLERARRRETLFFRPGVPSKGGKGAAIAMK
jgi:hypothetical protein